MHRYNKSLPPVYRDRVVGEASLLRKALLTLATSSWNDVEDDIASAVNETYELPKERALSALEKGVGKLLDLKYDLNPEDYPPIARALLRGAVAPSLDPGLRSKAARIANVLLSKRECNVPGGIQWRAVADTILREHVECINGAPFWGRDVRELHVRNLVSLLDKCVHYLPDGDDAKVIWDAFIGKIRKIDEDPDNAFLSFFIMSYILPIRGEQWTGWTEEGKRLWKTVENYPHWDAMWIALFARVTKNQPATVDFDDCVPRIYKLLSLSLNLPLGSVAPNSPQKRGVPRHIYFLACSDVVSSAACFTAYNISPISTVSRTYFDRIVVLLQNYCHPSNSGRWSHPISSFLSTFTNSLSRRITAERAATKAGVMERVPSDSNNDAIAPAEHRLSDEYVDGLVNMLFPLLKLCIHSKSGSMARHALSSLRDLAIVAPHLIVQPMIEMAQEGLEYVQSPHRTATALKILAALTPIFLDAEMFPAGAHSLPQALQLTLPGIDANDPSKTESTLRFISGAAARLPGLLKADVVPGMVNFLEDYVPTLLERLFTLFASLEAPAKKNRSGSVPSSSQISHLMVSVAMDNLFVALPHSLVLSAAKRISRQISSSATTSAMKQYGILVRIAARSAALVKDDNGKNPSPDIFLPILIGQLLDESTVDGKDKVVFSSLSKEELVWRIRMLAQACRCVGRGLDAYLDRLKIIIRLAMERNERPMYKAGGRLLRGILEGLTAIQVSSEPTSVKEELNEDGEQEQEVKWIIPTSSDWKLALDLVQEFYILAESMVFGDQQGSESRKVIMNRDTLFRALRLLHAVQRGARWLLGGVRPSSFDCLEKFETADVQMTRSEAMLALKRPVVAGLGGEIDANSRDQATKLWGSIYQLNFEILTSAFTERPDDGALLYRCLEPLELANEPLKRAGSGRQNETAAHHYKAIYKPVLSLKRPHRAVGSPGRAMPYFIYRLRIAGMHDLRLAYAARPGANNSSLFKNILKKVREYTLNAFPRVRLEARNILTRSLRIASKSQKTETVHTYIDLLEKAAEAAEGAQKSELNASVASITPVVVPDANGVVKMETDIDEPTVKPSKPDMHYEKMIGCCYVLRSAAVSPVIMRSVPFYDKMMRILVKAVLSADRPDAAGHVSMLLGRLLTTARPLTLDPVRFVEDDLLTEAPIDESANESQIWVTRRQIVEDLNSYLLGLLRKSPKGHSDSKKDSTEDPSSQDQVHWKLQSLVASLLFVNLRRDRSPSFDVASFFGKGVISDVVSLRQISRKALMVILALHGKEPPARLEPFSNFKFVALTTSSPMNDAIRALDELISSKGYVQKLIHMIALDYENSNGSSRSSQQSRTPGGFSSLMSVTSHADAYSSWLMYGGDVWPKSRVRRSADNISIGRVRFFEMLMQVFGYKAFAAFQKPVQDIVTKIANEEQGIVVGVKDEDVRIVIGEAVIGICRGMLMEHFENKDESIAMVTDWVLKILDSLTGPQGTLNGGTFIRLLNTAEPDSLGQIVVEHVFDWLLLQKPIIPPVESKTVVQLQARRLRYLYYSAADVSTGKETRINRVLTETTSELTSNTGFGHELKAVREEVARLLSLSAVFSDRNVAFDTGVDGVVEQLELSRVESGLNNLSDDLARMEISETENEDSEETVAKKLRSRLGETLSRKITLVYWNFPTLSFQKHLVKLLPSLFVSLDDSDSNRVSHARLSLSLVAQGVYDAEHLSKVISIVEATTKAPRWRIRGGVLPFVQVLSLMYLFTGPEKELDRLRTIVVNLISDEQIEVRAAAAATLLPMIRDAPPGIVTEIRESFMSVIKETQPPRRRAGSSRVPMSPDTIRRRHGAAFGLSSLVISSPYTVPEWMPSILVCLSNCVSDPPPISTSVKKLFVDFMRTHRDEWQMHKAAFTEEELDIVSELLVSPSYYA